MAFGIWNNLDEVALYIGLERLSFETDEEFYSRIKEFSKYRYKVDYYNQVHSIPIQVGLKSYKVFDIKCKHNNIDIKYKVDISWDYFIIENFPEDTSLKEYIRIFIGTPDCTVEKITNILDKSKTFKVEMGLERFKRLPCKFLIRDTNIGIGRDYIDNQYINLTHKNIVYDSEKSNNPTIHSVKKESLQDLKNYGDYYIDYKLGYIQSFSSIDYPFFFMYKYYKPFFTVEATYVNLIPLNEIAKHGITDDLIKYIDTLLENKVWGK